MYKTASLSDIADIKFCIIKPPKKNAGNLKCIVAANLLSNNVLAGMSENNKAIPDKSLRIYENDIIIKRINPFYINFIGVSLGEVYAYNNLIIVRAKEVNAKYLAYYLNREIKDFSESVSVGAITPSIGREDLENFKVPIPPIYEQKAIGEIWYQSIERKKMLLRLTELETEKKIYLINKYVDKNGRVKA